MYTEKNFFIVAGILILIAAVLDYIAIKKRRKSVNTRKDFAKKENLKYSLHRFKAVKNFKNGPMKQFEKKSQYNILTGNFGGLECAIFDIQPNTTIIGINKEIPTPFSIEFVRANSKAPTASSYTAIDALDLNRNWMIFSGRKEPGISFEHSNLETVFASLPASIEEIWLETDWILASMPKEKDLAIILTSLSSLAKISEELSLSRIN